MGILRKSPFQLVKERLYLFEILCKTAYVGSNHYHVVIHERFGIQYMRDFGIIVILLAEWTSL